MRWALRRFPENSDSFAASGRIGCRKFSSYLSLRWSSLSLGFGLQREECHERREDFLWVGTDCVAFRASPRTAARRYRRRAAGPSGNRLARRVGHHQGTLMRHRITAGSLHRCRLRGGGGSLERTRLSPIPCYAGKIQGISLALASGTRICRRNGGYNQSLTSKFPTRPNRELIGPYQGIKSTYQGDRR